MFCFCFKKKIKSKNYSLLKDTIYNHHLLFYDDKMLLYLAIDNIIDMDLQLAKKLYPQLIIIVDGQPHDTRFTRNRLHVKTTNNIITEITTFG